MFQELALTLESEIDTLCYPRAALFGFCVGLVAYNVLSGVKAGLRAVQGEEKVEEDLSAYYVADEIRGTYRGMMIAIPDEEWRVFGEMGVEGLAGVLRELAGRVRWEKFRKAKRGPKKARPKRKHNKNQPHVSTAKLLEARRKGRS
jgi:hypothetical protein